MGGYLIVLICVLIIIYMLYTFFKEKKALNNSNRSVIVHNNTQSYFVQLNLLSLRSKVMLSYLLFSMILIGVIFDRILNDELSIQYLYWLIASLIALAVAINIFVPDKQNNNLFSMIFNILIMALIIFITYDNAFFDGSARKTIIDFLLR